MERAIRPIKELCSFSSGHGFTRHDWTQHGLPIIRIAHLNGLRIFDYYSGPAEPEWIVEPGELLFAWAGTRGVSFGPTIWRGPRGVLNQHIYRVRAKDGVDGTWLYYALLEVTARIEKQAHGFKSTLLHVRKSSIEDQRVRVPDITTQRNIVARLAIAEACLSQVESLLDAKRAFRRGLAQQLLTGRKRFPKFVSSKARQKGEFGLIPKEWALVRIGEIADEMSERGAADDSVVYSCTKHNGLVPSLEYFGKQVFSRNLSSYKRLRTDDFAYATNHIEEGSIGLLRPQQKPGLVSPMYTVFRCSKEVNPEFLFALLKTENYRRVFEKRTSASVDRRGSLRWAQFSQIRVPLPSRKEQDRIAKMLSLVDSELALLGAQRENYSLYKRGLIARLLSGELPVAP